MARNLFKSLDCEFRETDLKVLSNFFSWEICDYGSSIEELSSLGKKCMGLSILSTCFCMLSVAVNVIFM